MPALAIPNPQGGTVSERRRRARRRPVLQATPARGRTHCDRHIDVCAMDIFTFTHRFDDAVAGPSDKLLAPEPRTA